MSFDGNSSTETLVVELSATLKLHLSSLPQTNNYPDVVFSNQLDQQRNTRQDHSTSALQTGDDISKCTTPQIRPKKERKRTAREAQQQNKVKEKLSEQITQRFAEQLSGATTNSSQSDILSRYMIPASDDSTYRKTLVGLEKVACPDSAVNNARQRSCQPQSDHKKTLTGKLRAESRNLGHVFCVNEVFEFPRLGKLLQRFGKVSHMGVLDSSYSMFLSKHLDGALLFKVYDKVAVISGDPLCEWHCIDNLLADFATYRKSLSLDVTFLGVTAEFKEYAKAQKWITMQFGVERVLNPITNPLILENGAGKRTILTAKQLLKKGISLGIYVPKCGSDEALQAQILDCYSAWCADRNDDSTKIQAYVSVLDPLSIPELMTYIYAKDAEGVVVGLAALRPIVKGYHIDPCVARPGSPRGISELLVLASMSLLRSINVDYLSLGFDPSPELGDITGIPNIALRSTRSIHRRSVASLSIGGKQAWYAKFYPDDSQQNDMFVVIPSRVPKIRHMQAVMHTANIDISKVLRDNIKKSVQSSLNKTSTRKEVAAGIQEGHPLTQNVSKEGSDGAT